jgi:Flp pilus assembly protein TadD
MPESPRLALHRARQMMEHGEAAEAAGLLASLRAPPTREHTRALFQGLAALRGGDAPEAERQTARAVALGPDNRLAANWHAVAVARCGDLRAAVVEIQRVGLVPYSGLLIELALLFENHLLCHPEKRPPTGLDPDILRSMAVGDLSAAPPPRRLGARAFERAYQRGNFRALLAHSSACLRSRHSDSEGRMVLVHCLSETRMDNDALDASRRLAQDVSDQAAILSQLGLIAVRAGDLREALTALAQVHIEGPEDFNSHWHLGLAALRAGDEGEARWFFAKALRDYFIGSFEDSWLRLWNAVTSRHFLQFPG